jgi:hypothetical protein
MGLALCTGKFWLLRLMPVNLESGQALIAAETLLNAKMERLHA